MAIGDSSKEAIRSYVAVGSESTFGSYNTATTALDVLSCGFVTNFKTMKLPTISLNRGMARRVKLDKEVAGSLETYAHPVESVLIFQSALGGAISTTVINATDGVYSHAINAGNFEGSIPSVCFNVRKGQSTVWEYSGGRVNSLKITGEVGEPVKVSAEYIFKDSTQTSNDVSSVLTLSSYAPFTYVDGTFKYSGTSEQITGFELTISNNLKSDKDARALGSDVLQVLPATRREIEFKITQRFDTITAWSRFTSADNAAVQLKFTGDAISASYNNEFTIDMPKVYYQSPDVQISSPDDLLMSEINFDVVVDNPYTSTGYDVKFTVQNSVSGY